jgi:hypothetical protein
LVELSAEPAAYSALDEAQLLEANRLFAAAQVALRNGGALIAGEIAYRFAPQLGAPQLGSPQLGSAQHSAVTIEQLFMTVQRRPNVVAFALSTPSARAWPIRSCATREPQISLLPTDSNSF